MKKNLLILLLGVAPFIISCKKDVIQDNANTNSLTERENCEPWQFGMLALNGGTMEINGIDNLTGDVGYSKNVFAITNQNVGNFEGTTQVHSLVTRFLFIFNTFQPLYGLLNNDSYLDYKMDQANSYATSLSTTYKLLPAVYTYGTVSSNKTIIATEMNTVVKMTSIDMNSKTLTLRGEVGLDQGFIINVSGAVKFSQSMIVLENVRPERILFNCTSSNNVIIDRTTFNGTILSPTGKVYCFEPPAFDGSIIAKKINLFSYGSILSGTLNQSRTAQGRSYNNEDNGGIDVSNCYWITNFTQRTYCNGNQW